MTRSQAINYVDHYFGENVKEEFERLEWKAAIRDKSSFYIYDTYLNKGVKIITRVENNQLKYDVEITL